MPWFPFAPPRVGCVAIGMDLRGAAPGSWGLAPRVRALRAPLLSGCDVQYGFARPSRRHQTKPRAANVPSRGGFPRGGSVVWGRALPAAATYAEPHQRKQQRPFWTTTMRPVLQHTNLRCVLRCNSEPKMQNSVRLFKRVAPIF